MTTDSDLAPLKSAYYNVDMSRINTTITIWNAYCCGTFQHKDNKTYRMYPLSHIGMTKTNWRMAMGLNKIEYNLDGDSVLKFILNIYGNEFSHGLKGDTIWYADQYLVSILIKEFMGKSENFQPVLKPYGIKYGRNFKGQRLDRTVNEREWNASLKNANSLLDAHLFKWQRGLFIRIFNSFLEKFFSNDTSVIKFYEQLVLIYWQNV